MRRHSYDICWREPNHREPILNEQPTVCPNCGRRGQRVGQLCEQSVCARNEFHAIPEAYAPNFTVGRDPMVGKTVDEYLVVKLLGAGGFGKVFLVLQQPIMLMAALKLVHGHHTSGNMAEQLLEKFHAEARALARLTHPNIVRLLKFGLYLGDPYMVMEFVEAGRTLEDELRSRARDNQLLSIKESGTILRQMADGLGAAHNRNLLHRDIKPENVMLQAVQGNPLFVRILDFGLVKDLSSNSGGSILMGTPPYMAPEQLKRGELGPWTDWYALGVVAFEMLTGRRPFPDTETDELFKIKLDPHYDPTSQLRYLKVPEPALAFLRQAISHDPETRIRTTEQFHLGLNGAIEAIEAIEGPQHSVSVAFLVDPLTQARPDVVTAGNAPSPGRIPDTQDATIARSDPGAETLAVQATAPGPPPPLPPIPAPAPVSAPVSGDEPTSDRLDTERKKLEQERNELRKAREELEQERMSHRVEGGHRTDTRPTNAGSTSMLLEQPPSRAKYWAALAAGVTLAVVIAAVVSGDAPTPDDPGKQAAVTLKAKVSPGPGSKPQGDSKRSMAAGSVPLSDATNTDNGAPANSPNTAAVPTDTSSASPASKADAAATAGAELPLVAVAAGDYPIGCQPGDAPCWDDEKPAHLAKLEAFEIMTREVSVSQYAKCVESGLCRTPATAKGCSKLGTKDKTRPVTCVAWADAKAFCKFNGLQLPTEQEWEAAARGPSHPNYTWGNQKPSCKLAHIKGCGSTAGAGDRAWSGATQMGANVREWTSSMHLPYPGSKARPPARAKAQAKRVTRGGSWLMSSKDLPTTHTRMAEGRTARRNDLGFRCSKISEKVK